MSQTAAEDVSGSVSGAVLRTAEASPAEATPAPVPASSAEATAPVSPAEAEASPVSSVEESGVSVPDSSAEASAPPVVSWRERHHGRLGDTELRQALQQTLLSARTAQQEARNAADTAESLRAAARPGGLVEQRVDALHDRVQAIAALDKATAEVRALESGRATALTEFGGLEEALAATGRLGRPALRGADREQAEQRHRFLGGELETLQQRLDDAVTRRSRHEALAGDPAGRERALSRWEELGGTREAVLAHAIADNDRRIRQAGAASEGFRTTGARLRPRITGLRAEQAAREAMTPGERRNEAAERASRGGPRPAPAAPSSPTRRFPGQEPGQER
ncbi:hypothetical protein [Kitasatospora sp. NPDC059599]|uniref:hypothetical protein n=1 Tax=Kitasatospora sp. NPDC059599 TaxID=3346880 RepID=UPI00367CFC16